MRETNLSNAVSTAICSLETSMSQLLSACSIAAKGVDVSSTPIPSNTATRRPVKWLCRKFMHGSY